MLGPRRVAARQLGLLTGAQARRIGFTHHEIQHRLEAGRWTSATRDVHVIGRDARTAGSATPWLPASPGRPRPWRHTGRLARSGGSLRPAPLPHVTVPADGERPAQDRQGPPQRPRLHRTSRRSAHPGHPGAAHARRHRLVRHPKAGTGAGGRHGVRLRAHEPASRSMAAIERSQRAPGGRGCPALLRALAPWTDAIQPESPAEARLVRRLADWRLPDSGPPARGTRPVRRPTRPHRRRVAEGARRPRVRRRRSTRPSPLERRRGPPRRGRRRWAGSWCTPTGVTSGPATAASPRSARCRSCAAASPRCEALCADAGVGRHGVHRPSPRRSEGEAGAEAVGGVVEELADQDVEREAGGDAGDGDRELGARSARGSSRPRYRRIVSISGARGPACTRSTRRTRSSPRPGS